MSSNKPRAHASLSRRALLAGGLAGITSATFGSNGSARALLSAAAGHRSLRGEVPRTLVIVQLSGGNDGLDTVVPYADDDYRRARTSLARSKKDVLRLDNYRGLHPRLESLRARYDEGQVAIVEGVGYPQPNRSHFKSLDIWHTARSRGRASGPGWIGRLCTSLYGSAADPNRVVHVGRSVPYSLNSVSHPPVCFSNPAAYRWVRGKSIDEYAEGPGERGSGALPESSSIDFVRSVLSDARESSLAVRRAAARYRTQVDYPRTDLAEALRGAAAILKGRIGAQVLSVEMSTFDTHDSQQSRREGLISELDAGLSCFLDDLAGTEVGAQTVVLVFSEFGRRVAANGSGGTDHGTAGPCFLLGEPVRGGLYGRHPKLSKLDSNGDLVHTTDFRSVYATLVSDWFGADATEVLGGDYAKLDLLG